MNNLKNYAPAVGWGIFIFIISTISGKDIPTIPDLWDLIKIDKLVHMTVYGILTWLILRGWSKSNPTATKAEFLITGIKTALICALFGLFLEWYQENYCEDRLFEVLDEVANAIGAFFAATVYYFYKSRLKKNV